MKWVKYMEGGRGRGLHRILRDLIIGYIRKRGLRLKNECKRGAEGQSWSIRGGGHPIPPQKIEGCNRYKGIIYIVQCTYMGNGRVYDDKRRATLGTNHSEKHSVSFI